VGDLWVTKSEVVGLIALTSQISNLRGHDPPTSQTDRQTDMQSQYCTLHYSASR